MAMTVSDLKDRLNQLSKDASITAFIPDGPNFRTENLVKCHHHNRDENDAHPEQPVEVFIGKGESLTAGKLLHRLNRFPAESLVRVAQSMPKEHPEDPGHHRILDIVTVGFGPNDEKGKPTFQLQTENWQSLYVAIRQDDHSVDDDLGDVSYSREGEVIRNESTGEVTGIPTGKLKMQHVGRVPEKAKAPARH